MEPSKEDKKRILEAYLKKTITKNDLIFLFEVGISVPPIQWKFKTEADEIRHQRKRDLVEIVLGRTFPKVKWIKK